MHDIENVPQDFKIHHLPLARIKKVMKTDEDVKVNGGVAAVFYCFEVSVVFCFIFFYSCALLGMLHSIVGMDARGKLIGNQGI